MPTGIQWLGPSDWVSSTSYPTNRPVRPIDCIDWWSSVCDAMPISPEFTLVSRNNDDRKQSRTAMIVVQETRSDFPKLQSDGSKPSRENFNLLLILSWWHSEIESISLRRHCFLVEVSLHCGVRRVFAGSQCVLHIKIDSAISNGYHLW